MKKLLLLLASGSIALSGYAQMRDVRFNNELPMKFQKVYNKSMLEKKHAAKTTAAPTRTYSYYDLFDTVNQDVSGWQSGLSNVYMFQDRAFLWQSSSSTYDTGDMVSAATILHPQHNSINNPTYYTGEMKITPTDAYVVNSVRVFGKYFWEPGATQIDTLVLSFVYGDGDATATGNGIFRGGHGIGGHYGGYPVISTRYDTTALNYARMNSTWGTPNTYVIKVPLGPSTFGDTTASGLWTREISLSPDFGSTGLSVPAGKQVGMSYSFISGKPLSGPFDTVLYADGTQKHNLWEPITVFATSDGTQAGVQFAPLDTTDYNQGLYKTLPHDDNGWSYIYVPQWSWTSSAASGASVLQHMLIDWNITCATCGNISGVGIADAALISKVNAYPNPAGDVLNVPFTLATATDVTVTLTNVLGQVIASQEMGNVATGTAKFNTISLPAGVYTYSVLANGQRSTGRVAIAH